MADINKRGPGCADDCGEGGEGGERGERGKRGKRGHRGHDGKDGRDGKDGHDGHDGHDGNTGPTGPTGPSETFGGVVTDQVNLLGDGTPSDILRLSTFQLFAEVQRTIFVRPSPVGNDATGDGSALSPLATFQAALLRVPTLIPAGTRYKIDLTGLGVETLPVNFAMPIIQAAEVTPRFVGFSGVFIAEAALTIEAQPQLVSTLPPGEAVITAADLFVVTTDPDTNLAIITVPGVRPSWAADALAGKQIIRTGGGGPPRAETSSVIYGSTDDDGFGNAVLRVANRLPFIVDAATLGAAEYQIVEPSATLEAPTDPDNFDFAAIRCLNVFSIAWHGIRLRAAGGNPDEFLGISVSGADQPWFELCDLPHGLEARGAELQFAIFSTQIGNALGEFGDLVGEGGQLSLRRSRLLNAGLALGTDDVDIFNTVFDGCAPLTGGQFFFGRPLVPQAWGIRNTLIQNSQGDGIAAFGGRWELVFVQVNDSAGHGIANERGVGYMVFTHVTGTGNGGVGVRVNDGARVQLADGFSPNPSPPGPPVPVLANTTSITGTAPGSDMQVGSLQARTWVDFYGTAPINNEYDLSTPFVVASSGVEQPPGDELTGAGTGGRSGSRLFLRP